MRTRVLTKRKISRFKKSDSIFGTFFQLPVPICPLERQACCQTIPRLKRQWAVSNLFHPREQSSTSKSLVSLKSLKSYLGQISQNGKKAIEISDEISDDRNYFSRALGMNNLP